MSDLAKRESRADVVQLDRPFFSPEQEEMIRKSFLNGATAQEAAVLLEVAKLRKLNPITKQVHFVKRGNIWSVQVGIDGMRSIAERSGKYAGQDEPVYEDNRDGSIKLCKVAVYRKDWDRPAVGVAYFTEYAQQSNIWKQYPRVMISKCAEALALRKAFPEDLSGIYEPSEMGDDSAPRPTAKDAVQAKLAQIQAKKEVPQEVVDPPHDVTTGEVQQEAGPEVPELTIPFGKEKGVRLSEATDRTLSFVLDHATKTLNDPAKARWHEANRHLAEAIELEIAARREREQ